MNERLRTRFVEDSIATASPARLLCMLYDRLLLDVELADRALADGDKVEGTRLLSHAHAIVLELRAALDVSVWSGGPGLAALYSWLLVELTGAMVHSDRARVAGCRPTIASLRDAWHEAAVTAPATGLAASA